MTTQLVRGLRRFGQLRSVDWQSAGKAFYENTQVAREKAIQYLGRETGLRMLDVGCDEACPATILFTIWGWRVTGIDLDYPWRGSAWRALSVAARGGPRNLAKKIVREILVSRRFQSAVLKAAGAEMPKNLDIHYMSVCDLRFGDDEFDYVYSHAVLEHVEDLDRGMAEMARVMKPGAVGRHLIHLFTSLSGGHDPAWEKPDERAPEDVLPWNHLLTGQSPSIHYLNRWREKDYRRCFEEHFEILEWNRVREGERYLTSDLREALKDYSEDELLTRDLEVIVRKPSQPH